MDADNPQHDPLTSAETDGPAVVPLALAALFGLAVMLIVVPVLLMAFGG